MATVRFSEQLKSEILGNAKRLFKQQKESAVSSFPDGVADTIYDKFFTADVVGKMNALPDGFLKTKESIEFSGFQDIPEGVADKHMYTTSSVMLTFSSARRWPETWPEQMTGAKIDWRALRLHWNDDRWDDVKKHVFDYNQRIQTIEQKEETFVEGVKEIINTYATLAPALKAWPALWDLVPDDAKERHKKIVERVKKEASDITADLNTLTAQVTFSKLTK